MGPHQSGPHGPFDEDPPQIHRCGASGLGEAQSRVDLGPHLVAPLTDGRPQMEENVLAARPELLLEDIESRLQNSRHRPSPTRMDDGRNPTRRIGQEDGDTVRHRHRHESPGGRGDVPIGVRSDGKAHRCLEVKEDLLPVKLAGMRHTPEPVAQRQLQPALVHKGWLRFTEEPEIPLSPSGAPSGRPLNQPGKPLSPLRVDPANER